MTLFLVDESGAKLALEGRAAEIAFALRMIQDEVNRFECGSVEVHFKHADLTVDVTGRGVYRTKSGTK